VIRQNPENLGQTQVFVYFLSAMQLPTSRKPASASVAIALMGLLLTGCSSTDPKLGMDGIYAANGKTSGREYFSSASLGVNASPRVGAGARMPRGGGRDQVGKPYTVAGKTYYPTETPRETQIGLASWYGAAFHGRMTANGEVYDMTHLTAAHKTFPLPSYARVTNLENGRTLVVRVNDRGPFADDRVIDLSKRAADLLDYTGDGVAQVKVEYAGRAPLDGQDDAFLLASVQGVPGYDPNRPWQPDSDVMIAMNGSTPDSRPTPVGGIRDAFSSGASLIGSAFGLTTYKPKPRAGLSGSVSAYASDRVSRAFAGDAFSGLAASDWKSR
jgi:rare lipoprotein A